MATEGTAVFQSTTKLIEVNVVVRDKQGRLVGDLGKEEFAIDDNGDPQPIALFSTERDTPLPPIASPSNMFTNRVAAVSGRRDGYAVVLLDWLNTDWVDQAQARDQVIRMLRQIEPEDKVGLYVLGRGLRVVHDFTSDAAALLAKLKVLTGQTLNDDQSTPSSPLDASIGIEGDLFGGAAGQPAIPFRTLAEKIQAQDLRVFDTLAALEQIGAQLAGVPGRKSLIWVSAGFPMAIDGTVIPGARPGERVYSTEIDRAIRKLNDADVAVYPVDARGLLISTYGHINIGAMNEIASRTGGVAYSQSNDLAAGVRIGLDDLRATYTLGYYLPEAAVRDGFRRIRVRVNRPGLTLRYRRGYYVGGSKEEGEQVTDAVLQRALLSPVDLTALPLEVRLDRQVDALELNIGLEVSSLLLRQREGRWQGRIEILARFTSPDGSQLGAVSSHTIEVNMLQPTYEAALRDGFATSLTLAIPAHATNLRVLAWDENSTQIGTVSVPLQQTGEQAVER